MIEMCRKDDIVEIEASGTLNSQDYERLIPRLEQVVEEDGGLKLYVELRDFHGWTPTALWKDVRFDIAH